MEFKCLTRRGVKDMKKTYTFLILTLLFGQALLGHSVTSDEIPSQNISLPTPRSHYEHVQSGASGAPLLLALVNELDPATQKAVMTELNSPQVQLILSAAETGFTGVTRPPEAQTISLLQQINWTTWRPLMSEFMLHQSRVLEIIPPKYQEFLIPIVHDSLLYFLDHLPQERFIEKLVDIAYLPKDATRGDYLAAFVSKTPSLQKVGQILARNPALSPEYQAALQLLENDIHSVTRDELARFISDDVGKDNIDKYDVEIADQILAEGSVGAVIRVTFLEPTSSARRRQAICKVIKPYALINLPQELEIIDGLADYFTKEHDFYQLGVIPLGEMFTEVKKALTDEINIVREQQNLANAWRYYRGNKNIVVPELYPFSTKNVTFMEFIVGEKITNAFKGQPEQRAIMAKRLLDVMTRDVIFAESKESVFHGDPHAGNVFHVTGDPKDPYQIALLDWGLYGTFPRKDRVALMQLMLGVQLKDAKRLHNYVGALLADGMPDSPEKIQQIDGMIAKVLSSKNKGGSFDALAELLASLINEGYATKFSLNLFIKSQVTIAGILKQLDPKLDQDAYLMQQVISLVKKEIPKRILFTVWFPAWNSHSYRSLLSNKDILDVRRLSKQKEKER